MSISFCCYWSEDDINCKVKMGVHLELLRSQLSLRQQQLLGLKTQCLHNAIHHQGTSQASMPNHQQHPIQKLHADSQDYLQCACKLRSSNSSNRSSGGSSRSRSHTDLQFLLLLCGLSQMPWKYRPKTLDVPKLNAPDAQTMCSKND